MPQGSILHPTAFLLEGESKVGGGWENFDLSCTGLVDENSSCKVVGV